MTWSDTVLEQRRRRFKDPPLDRKVFSDWPWSRSAFSWWTHSTSRHRSEGN